MRIIRDRDRADELRGRLRGPRKYDVPTLDEIVAAGEILFGDPDGLSYYGLAPPRWYALGVRMLGRTCVEATPDVTAAPIAATVRGLIPGGGSVGVVDLFAGSANLLFHVASALSRPGQRAPARGMEADAAVWARTTDNLRLVGGGTVTVHHDDWTAYFADPLAVDTTVYVVSPPWAGAFSFADGLDLTRTEPPVPLIVDTIAARDRSARCYAVVQHTPVEPVLNVGAVTARHPLLGAGEGCFVVAVHRP
jgi:hypothetical protein